MACQYFSPPPVFLDCWPKQICNPPTLREPLKGPPHVRYKYEISINDTVYKLNVSAKTQVSQVWKLRWRLRGNKSLRSLCGAVHRLSWNHLLITKMYLRLDHTFVTTFVFIAVRGVKKQVSGQLDIYYQKYHVVNKVTSKLICIELQQKLKVYNMLGTYLLRFSLLF